MELFFVPQMFFPRLLPLDPSLSPYTQRDTRDDGLMINPSLVRLTSFRSIISGRLFVPFHASFQRS